MVQLPTMGYQESDRPSGEGRKKGSFSSLSDKIRPATRRAIDLVTGGEPKGRHAKHRPIDVLGKSASKPAGDQASAKPKPTTNEVPHAGHLASNEQGGRNTGETPKATSTGGNAKDGNEQKDGMNGAPAAETHDGKSGKPRHPQDRAHLHIAQGEVTREGAEVLGPDGLAISGLQVGGLAGRDTLHVEGPGQNQVFDLGNHTAKQGNRDTAETGNEVPATDSHTDKRPRSRIEQQGDELARETEAFLFDQTSKDGEKAGAGQHDSGSGEATHKKRNQQPETDTPVQHHEGTATKDRSETAAQPESPQQIYGRIAKNLLALKDNYTITARGLHRKAEKRLRQTPEVPQEVIRRLLDSANDPALPITLSESGWRKAGLTMNITSSENASRDEHRTPESVNVTVFTYPEEITKITPTEYYSGAPEFGKTYFESSNLVGYGSGTQNLDVMTGGWEPGLRHHKHGIRNPGTYNYDGQTLHEIGVADYTNPGSQYQYVVRAEVGITVPGALNNTRYIVYETCQTPTGESKLLVARADTVFQRGRERRIDGIDTKGTSHIPAAEEVNLLTETLRMYADTRKNK